MYLDTPHRLKPDGFSVHRRSYRHHSPKGLLSPSAVVILVSGLSFHLLETPLRRAVPLSGDQAR